MYAGRSFGGRAVLILLAVLLLSPMSGLTTDIYVPSLPHVMAYFHTSPFLTRLTIPVYLFGYGVFQLISGPLMDSYGRRNIIIGMLFGYIVVSLLVPFSPNIFCVLLCRFLQGVMIAGPGVGGKAVLADSYQGKALAKYSAYSTTAWALGPIVAPFIGGYLQDYFGWKSSFYFIAGYGLLTLLVVFLFLPETNKNIHPFKFSVIINNYKKILSHRVFIGTILLLGFTASVIFVFNVLAPFLIQVVMQYSAITYGHVALLLGVAWFIGNIIARYVVVHAHVNYFVRWALVIATLCSVFMLLIGYVGKVNLWNLIVPTILVFVFSGIVFAYAFGKCLSLFPTMAGSASGLMGSLFILISSLTSTLASIFPNKTQVPIAYSFIGFMLLSLIFYCAMVMKSFKDHECSQ